MKINIRNVMILLYIMLTTFCNTSMEDEKHLSSKFPEPLKEQVISSKKGKPVRLQRQNRPTRPPGILIAVTSLLGGTVSDTFTAYRNLSRLIQGAFAPPRTTTGNQTAPANTTTFTLRQALALLGRNYQGLRRLFDREFEKALNVSDQNVMQFRKELKDSARVFLEYQGGNAVR